MGHYLVECSKYLLVNCMYVFVFCTLMSDLAEHHINSLLKLWSAIFAFWSDKYSKKLYSGVLVTLYFFTVIKFKSAATVSTKQEVHVSFQFSNNKSACSKSEVCAFSYSYFHFSFFL